jgi:hypothetical protein
MTIDDKFLEIAVSRARRIQADIPEFQLNLDKTHRQGNKNPITCGFYGDVPVVMKYFDDRIRPDSSRRKGIESFFLRHVHQCREIPRLVAEFDDCLIMTELPGKPVEEFSAKYKNSEEWILNIGRYMGIVHSKIAKSILTVNQVNEYQNLFFDSRGTDEFFFSILHLARESIKEMPSLSTYMSDIDAIECLLPDILKEPSILYKYDNNLGNVLATESGFSGLIDFEECYIGTETIYLGALFDCIHRIPWNADSVTIAQWPSWERVREGYEAESGLEIGGDYFKLIVLAAKLNAWQRVVRTWQAKRKLDFWEPRHLLKMQTLESYAK